MKGEKRMKKKKTGRDVQFPLTKKLARPPNTAKLQ